MSWKTIRVPEELYAQLEELSGDKAIWKAIDKLLKTRIPKRKVEKMIDRALWYFFKATTSYAVFKELLPTAESSYQRTRLIQLLEQIQKRLGIDLTESIHIIKHQRKWTRRQIGKMNMALKREFRDWIMQNLIDLLGEEDEPEDQKL